MAGDRTQTVDGTRTQENASYDPEHRDRGFRCWSQVQTKMSKATATVNKRLRLALGQPTSPLLQLPGEVRNMIYAYVFSDIEWSAVMCYARIHNTISRDFINRKTYWGWVRLLISKWYPTGLRAYYRYMPKYSNLGLDSDPPSIPCVIPIYYRALALTQTCRQIRAESRLLPYKTASYTKVDSQAFRNWLMELDMDTRSVVLAAAQR